MTKLQRVRSTIVLALLTASAAAQTSYFPVGTFSADARYDHFVRGWYSGVLRAAEEPSLSSRTKSKTFQSYRFLWLRSFNDTVSIRLDINPDGTATLVEKTLGDRMSPTPGKITHREVKNISVELTQRFQRRLTDGCFWELPTDIHHDGCDGAEWIIEGAMSGKYHLAMRWSPEKGLVRDLGIDLLDLAGIKVPQKEIY